MKAAGGQGGAISLIRVSSGYVKVVVSVPGQGTYKNQPVNANKWNNKSMLRSLSKEKEKAAGNL